MDQLQNGHVLLVEELMAGAWDEYNNVVATYFVSTQQDHYILKSRYLPEQTGRQKLKD
jgi:hypothetical protein